MKVRESNSTAAEEALGKWSWYQPSRDLRDAAAMTPVSAMHKLPKLLSAQDRMEPQLTRTAQQRSHWLQGIYTESSP